MIILSIIQILFFISAIMVNLKTLLVKKKEK